MWRVIDMKNLENLNDIPYTLIEMCCHAVDRSKGELIDINIEYFGTDELLQYIAKTSSQLRRLRIVGCYDISGEVLSEAAENFPELEELHLFFMSSTITAEDIESIGLSCPKLKSFTYNKCWYEFPIEHDQYPTAIGNSMPNLRHLRLFGNGMTTEGLLPILDGCPQLESLDLRQCFNVDLREDIVKRCSQQIKSLKCPLDSTSDYEWDADNADEEFDHYSNFSDYSDGYSLDIMRIEDYSDPFGAECISDRD